MNKKKIVALLVAGVMTIGVVGGTFAWFTSNDSVTNVFNTGKTEDKNDINSGIKIDENFIKDDANEVLPGDNVKKEVRVKNTASYDQFIRAKIEKVWKIDGEIVTHYTIEKVDAKDAQENVIKKNKITYHGGNDIPEGAKQLDTSLIVLKFDSNLTTTKENNKWIDGNDLTKGEGEPNDDGYYYYNGVVPNNEYTNYLLSSVELSKDANDVYKNLTFDVTVTAESVQALNGAAGSTWGDSPIEELAGYKAN